MANGRAPGPTRAAKEPPMRGAGGLRVRARGEVAPQVTHSGRVGSLSCVGRLLVVLQGEVVGEITEDGEDLRFAYSGAAVDGTPLSLSMPRQQREHPDGRIRPWLGGLMPHDADVLQRWAARVGLEGAARPERLLGTRIGWDCAGAVQFCPPEDLAAMQGRHSGRRPVSDAEIAEALRTAIDDMRGPTRVNPAAPRLGPAYSLAGGQPKIALARGGDRWHVPTGAEPSTHILKPPPGSAGEQPANEHLCLTTARRLGLTAAASTLSNFEDLAVVVVERYDRARDGAGIRRLHQEDTSQALGRGSDTRFEALGGVSTVRIAELLRAHGAADDVGTVVDRLALAWALGLIDGHGKNTSLLLAGDQVTLAPLYDIASMLPYAPDGNDVYLAMHVGDQPDVARIGRADWEHHARRLRLAPADVLERVERIASEAAPAAQAVAEACTDPIDGDFPERFAAAAAHWQQHCLNALTTTPHPRPRRPDTGLGLTCLA